MWTPASCVSAVLGRPTAQNAMKLQASTGLRPAYRRRPSAVGESRDWKVESRRARGFVPRTTRRSAPDLRYGHAPQPPRTTARSMPSTIPSAFVSARG
jgi:hypothetical protein